MAVVGTNDFKINGAILSSFNYLNCLILSSVFEVIWPRYLVISELIPRWLSKRGAWFWARSLESLMEGQFVVPRRSIIVCFLSLLSKACLNLPLLEISCSWLPCFPPRLRRDPACSLPPQTSSQSPELDTANFHFCPLNANLIMFWPFH
jgi:hypothetical protein